MTKDEMIFYIEKRYLECSKRNQGLSFGSFYDGYMECYAELKKENAELKSIADFQTSSNMDIYFQLKRSKEQLTKAKEIIKKLVNGVRVLDDPKVELTDCDRFLAEAEQFLKEGLE